MKWGLYGGSNKGTGDLLKAIGPFMKDPHISYVNATVSYNE